MKKMVLGMLFMTPAIMGWEYVIHNDTDSNINYTFTSLASTPGNGEFMGTVSAKGVAKIDVAGWCGSRIEFKATSGVLRDASIKYNWPFDNKCTGAIFRITTTDNPKQFRASVLDNFGLFGNVTWGGRSHQIMSNEAP